ncbi:MAG TPA: GNAT family N-acetyltransferase [Dehalococcoidia bacterium]|nr:GNAT family N-acetyltransferase [Dehalococcoidia bacterium]
MSDWLGATVVPEWRLEDLRDALDTHNVVLIGDEGAAPLGMAVVLTNQPSPDAVTIPFLTIDPERRFRGLGGEAGLALERCLRQKLGASKVYAPVPEARGLAVYFWLRLGYRPLSAAASPGPLLGLTGEAKPGIWMLREKA